MLSKSRLWVQATLSINYNILHFFFLTLWYLRVLHLTNKNCACVSVLWCICITYKNSVEYVLYFLVLVRCEGALTCGQAHVVCCSSRNPAILGCTQTHACVVEHSSCVLLDGNLGNTACDRRRRNAQTHHLYSPVKIKRSLTNII